MTATGVAQAQSKLAVPSLGTAVNPVPPESPLPLRGSTTRVAELVGLMAEVQSVTPGCELLGPTSSKTDVWSWSVEIKRTAPTACLVETVEAIWSRQGLSISPGMFTSPTMRKSASSAWRALRTMGTVQEPLFWRADGP